MRKFNELTIHEKINIKQHAMNVHGKRWHTGSPDFCDKLSELAIISILSRVTATFSF